jgi:hypothetical protein
VPAAEHLGVEPGALLDIADRDAEMRDGSDRDHHRPSRFAVCRLFMRARLRDLAERGARLLRRFASCNDILLAVTSRGRAPQPSRSIRIHRNARCEPRRCTAASPISYQRPDCAAASRSSIRAVFRPTRSKRPQACRTATAAWRHLITPDKTVSVGGAYSPLDGWQGRTR